MRVLVVEDEESVAVGVQRCLAAEGHEVGWARDGAAALTRTRAESFDLVILDIMLPSMNGYLVCEAMRAAGDWTPILMLTAKSGEYDEAEGLETGADDFLSKPFSVVVLSARVRALLRLLAAAPRSSCACPPGRRFAQDTHAGGTPEGALRR